MSVYHITNGEMFWAGIRDGGSAHRRAQMYAFMARYQRDPEVRKSSDARRVYEVCQRTARELSRTKNWKKPG